MRPDEIARVCHEANRALQTVHADPSVPVSDSWEALDDDTRRSAIAGVNGVLSGLDPEESHEAWCRFKRGCGWTYGPVKDETARTHPCLVPYGELPDHHRVKDELFGAIVDTLGEVAEVDLDLAGRHPGVVDLLRWLTPNPRLTGPAASVAGWFHSTARVMVMTLDDSPELTTGLRKLLEAKDCMVRASL